MSLKRLRGVLAHAYRHWCEVGAAGKSAAVAYYAMFSLIPMLLLVLSVAGQYREGEYLSHGVLVQVQNTLGRGAGVALVEFINNSRRPGQPGLATAISIFLVVWGSFSLMSYLRYAFNTIWRVRFHPQGTTRWMRWRRSLVGLSTVCGGGSLLLVANTLSTTLGYFQRYWPAWLGSGDSFWNTGVPHCVTFILTVMIFALLFRALPDVLIDWEDTWIGAVTTALLFTSGRVLMTFYFEHAATRSSYGAAGSLVVLLVWFYWTSQLLFLGACFTRCLALERGKSLHPAPGAHALKASWTPNCDSGPLEFPFVSRACAKD